MRVLAVVRVLEVVGEAASGVTEEGRTSMAAIPWRQVVGMRNRLIHAYFDVDLDRVWDTVRHDLPPMVTAVEAALDA